jgi:hypothetical protein
MFQPSSAKIQLPVRGLMTPQKKSPVPAEKVALYEKSLATLPGVEQKGADNPYTSLNGNMFSLLSAMTETVALRLPK